MLVSVHRQRTGEDMSGLNLQELCQLQESISKSVAEISERKVSILFNTLLLHSEAKWNTGREIIQHN